MKEKMENIFNAMVDIALANLEKIKAAEGTPTEEEMQIISATLQMYNAIAGNHQQEIFQ